MFYFVEYLLIVCLVEMIYFWLNDLIFIFLLCRLSGVLLFYGELVEEICWNIIEVKYEFNLKYFELIL